LDNITIKKRCEERFENVNKWEKILILKQ